MGGAPKWLRHAHKLGMQPPWMAAPHRQTRAGDRYYIDISPAKSAGLCSQGVVGLVGGEAVVVVDLGVFGPSPPPRQAPLHHCFGCFAACLPPHAWPRAAHPVIALIIRSAGMCVASPDSHVEATLMGAFAFVAQVVQSAPHALPPQCPFLCTASLEPGTAGCVLKRATQRCAPRGQRLSLRYMPTKKPFAKVEMGPPPRPPRRTQPLMPGCSPRNITRGNWIRFMPHTLFV